MTAESLSRVKYKKIQRVLKSKHCRVKQLFTILRMNIRKISKSIKSLKSRYGGNKLGLTDNNKMDISTDSLFPQFQYIYTEVGIILTMVYFYDGSSDFNSSTCDSRSITCKKRYVI